MIIELIIALILGITAGTLTGLIPGVHINLVSLLLLISSPALLVYFPTLALVVFIVSMSVTHTLIDFIPSIFLGCPNEDTSLAVLPGHKFLQQGRGYEAVVLALIGGITGIIIILAITPLFIILLPFFISDNRGLYVSYPGNSQLFFNYN